MENGVMGYEDAETAAQPYCYIVNSRSSPQNLLCIAAIRTACNKNNINYINHFKVILPASAFCITDVQASTDSHKYRIITFWQLV